MYDYKSNQELPGKSNKPFDSSGKTAGNRAKKHGESWTDYSPRFQAARLAKAVAKVAAKAAVGVPA